MLKILYPPAGEPTPSVKSETIDIAFDLALLQRHPTTYTVRRRFSHSYSQLTEYRKSCHADRFLRSLMRSLTSPSYAFVLSADYVRAFLSVDYLRHPLLLGCQVVLPPSGNPLMYDVSTKNFPQIRIGMLDSKFRWIFSLNFLNQILITAILANLNGLIEGGDRNTDHFAQIVVESFSTMRQVLIVSTPSFSYPFRLADHCCRTPLAVRPGQRPNTQPFVRRSWGSSSSTRLWRRGLVWNSGPNGHPMNIPQSDGYVPGRFDHN